MPVLPSSANGFFDFGFNATLEQAYLPKDNYRLNSGYVVAILMGSDRITVIIDGLIASEFSDGIFVSDSSRSLIKVGSEGLVTGGYGVNIIGSLIRVENAGEISANAYLSTGAAVYAQATSEDIALLNSGTMSGGYGVFSEARNISLTNSGTVSGVGTGILVSGNLSVSNEGLIVGYRGIVSTGIAGTVVDIANGGTLRSTNGAAIDVANARTTIVNDGRIVGDVILGSANDRVDTSGGRITGTIFTGGGNDAIFGGERGDLVNAGLGNDGLAGRGGEDTLNGGGGNDVVRGGADDDNLVGDVGFDVLFGNAGEDTLGGGADNDRLVGGRGNDVLVGGTGNDVFAFGRGSGHDVVTDFFGADRLDVQAFGLPNFAAVRALAHQGGGGTLLDFGHDDTVLLPAVRLASLNAGDFIV